MIDRYSNYYEARSASRERSQKKVKDENDNAVKEVKHKTRKVKKSMVDVVSDDSFDLRAGLGSEHSCALSSRHRV